MEYNKLIIKDVEACDFNNFIKELKRNRTLKIKSYKPANDKVLQERFAFVCEFDNISIVYETRARCIIITAADYLLSLLNADFLRAKENRASYVTAEKPVQSAPNNRQQNAVPIKKLPPPPAKSAAIFKTQQPNGQVAVNSISAKNNATIKPNQHATKQSHPHAKLKPIPAPQTTNTPQKPQTITPTPKPTQISTPKPTPAPAPKPPPPPPAPPAPKKTKKAIEMEKKLKKLLPNAFELLCEQSKTDFIIGMTDITNDHVRLSDYSMLLVPLYRALERIIFDLQQAENINVKMIGQGYEKDDAGRYMLKSGYQKRIGSIVYGEVMAALYTEYFEKRNFYAHSDITGDALSRVITDKAAVKKILTELVEKIEYNAKKLKEIGFSLKPVLMGLTKG